VVYIPAHAARDALRGERATVLAYYNATFTAAGAATVRDIASAVQSLNFQLARSQTAAILGPRAVHAPPLRVQSTMLHNPQGSYELMLVLLLHPALLHLLLCVCVIGAVGRELRDGTAGDWLAACDHRAPAAVLGKLAPYVLVFTAYALLGSLYMSKLRGWPLAGSAALLVLAQMLLMGAYAAAAVLFVGLTKTMSQALSFAGLYAGASFAFAGAFFPTTGASPVVQLWSATLPFTHFAKLQAEQFLMGAPLAVSLPRLGTLCVFVVAFAVPGAMLYLKAARRPEDWGRR
jgi:ABC-2 type transport system permease protein